MKILIVTPFLPYSRVYHAGGKFIYEIIKVLSQKHDIYLLSRIEPDQFVFINEIKQLCKGIELLFFKTPKSSSYISSIPIIISYLRLGLKANRFIKKNVFDLVQVEYVETGLLIEKKKNIPMILDAHDVITKPAYRRFLKSKGLKRCFNYLRWKLTMEVERFIARKFHRIFTKSKQDRNILLQLDNTLEVSIVPHPILENHILNQDIVRKSNVLLFAGAMHRDVNIEAVLYFYNKILPLVRQRIPEVKFYIVGHKPPNKVREIARRDPRVIVTGFVDDLRPYYLKATVFVSPLLIGGGIIVKNLDAMAMGLPVVTTSFGNEGIGAIPDKHILVADDPKEFAEKVIFLLKDKHRREEIAKSGKEFVKNRFSLNSVIDRIERSYSELVINKNLFKE